MTDYPDYLQDEEDSPETRAAKAQYSALRSMLDSGSMPQMGSPEYASGQVEESAIQPDDLAQAAAAVGTGGLSLAGTLGAKALAAKAGAAKVGLPLLMGTLAKKGEQGIAKTLEQKAALDMSEAARMARAKEMGFNPEQTWYHATPATIKQFRQKGVENPEVTAFFTPDKNFANQWVYEQGNEEGANIIPAHLRTQKTFDPANPQHLEEIKEGLYNRYKDEVMNESFDPSDTRFRSLGVKEKIAKINKRVNDTLDSLRQYDWRTIEQPENLQLLKGAGFDSTLLKEDPSNPRSPKNIAVFHPSQIRSKFAAFDPAKASSGDLAASLAGAGLSLPALKALLEKNKTSKDEL